LATFGALVNRVKKDLRATEGLRVSEDDIKDALNDAITFYETERFTFNEGDIHNGLGVTITTVAETGSYAVPAAALTIDSVHYLAAANDNYPLNSWTWGQYVRATANTGTSGGPSHYVHHGGYLHFYPTPSETTTVTLSGIVRLSPSPLSVAAHTNAWTNVALPLIRARACWDISLYRLANPDRAVDFEKAEFSALSTLKSRVMATAMVGRAVVDDWDEI
jgi:hypothetical protein